MAFKLDNQLLEELGLAALPPQEKQAILRQILETLEMRVGTTLASRMSDAQLDEFERLMPAEGDDQASIQQKEQQALQWLESNFPNYKQVVNDELEKLKAEIRQSAPQILANSQQNSLSASFQPPPAPAQPYAPPMAPPATSAPVPTPPSPYMPQQPAAPTPYAPPMAQPSYASPPSSSYYSPQPSMGPVQPSQTPYPTPPAPAQPYAPPMAPPATSAPVPTPPSPYMPQQPSPTNDNNQPYQSQPPYQP